jgi:hypothetical protein
MREPVTKPKPLDYEEWRKKLVETYTKRERSNVVLLFYDPTYTKHARRLRAETRETYDGIAKYVRESRSDDNLPWGGTV